MIGLGLTRNIREIVIAQCVLLGKGPVGGNVFCGVLHLCGTRNSAGTLVFEPGVVTMPLIRVRIDSMRKARARHPGKGTEVIVEGVILFGNDDYVRDGRHEQLLQMFSWNLPVESSEISRFSDPSHNCDVFGDRISDRGRSFARSMVRDYVEPGSNAHEASKAAIELRQV